MIGNLQDRVRVLDNAVHHGGERGAGPAMIIWHSIRDKGGAESAIEYLNTTDEKVASYHYLIDRDGAIKRMCRPEWVAYHAGDSAWPHPKVGDGTESCKPNGGKSVNAISLGIAFCTDDDGANNRDEGGAGDDEHITDKQRESGLWLAKVYMSRYDIPPSLNLGHKEVSPGRKTDPIGLDMADWRRQIGALFA